MPSARDAFDLRVRAARRFAAGQAGPERRPPEGGDATALRGQLAERPDSFVAGALDDVDDREVAVEAADAPAEHERPPGAVRRHRQVLARRRQAADPRPLLSPLSSAKTSLATAPGLTPPA